MESDYLYSKYILYIEQQTKILDNKNTITSIPYKSIPSLLLFFLEVYNSEIITYTPKHISFLLKYTISNMNKIFSGLSVTTGYSFLGLLIQISSEFFDPEFKIKFIESIDSLLLEQLNNHSNLHNFDLINGLTGIGIYLRTAHNVELEAALTSELINNMYSMLEKDDTTDFGLSHGISGPLAFLSSTKISRIKNSSKFVDVCNKLYLCLENSNQKNIWYSKKEKNVLFINPYPYSWCYGYTGINIAKYFYLKNISNRKLLTLVKKWDYEINNSLNNLNNIVSPSIICHGLLGVLIGKKLFIDIELHTDTNWDPFLELLEKDLENQIYPDFSAFSFLDGQLSTLLGMISLISSSATLLEKLLFFQA